MVYFTLCTNDNGLNLKIRPKAFQHAYILIIFSGFPVGNPGSNFGFPPPFLGVSEIRKPSNFAPCESPDNPDNPDKKIENLEKIENNVLLDMYGMSMEYVKLSGSTV